MVIQIDILIAPLGLLSTLYIILTRVLLFNKESAIAPRLEILLIVPCQQPSRWIQPSIAIPPTSAASPTVGRPCGVNPLSRLPRAAVTQHGIVKECEFASQFLSTFTPTWRASFPFSARETRTVNLPFESRVLNAETPTIGSKFKSLQLQIAGLCLIFLDWAPFQFSWPYLKPFLSARGRDDIELACVTEPHLWVSDIHLESILRLVSFAALCREAAVRNRLLDLGCVL